MRSLFLPAIVAALTATTTAIPFPGPVAIPDGEPFATTSSENFLRPIKLSDLEPQDGLAARTLPDFSCFKPSSSASMLFGGLAGIVLLPPVSKSQLTIAYFFQRRWQAFPGEHDFTRTR